MFAQRAIRSIPRFAVVESITIDLIEQSLRTQSEDLQGFLDQGFRDFESEQPALAEKASEILARSEDELVQSLGFFLAVMVHRIFREAFPTRVAKVDGDALELAEQILVTDEQLRDRDARSLLRSDDVIAMGQPALMNFIQRHIDEAIHQASDEIDIEALDRVYRCILVQVTSLSHAVISPMGHVGPPHEALA